MKRCVVLGALLAMIGVGFVLGGASGAGEPGESRPKPTNLLVEYAARQGLPEVGSATNTKLKIGDTLPPLACVGLDGKPLKLDDLYGEKATLVICWATWCGPCMAALPHEASLARAYHDKGLRVIGVNGDEDPADARAVMDVLTIKWPTIHEPKDRQRSDGFVETLEIMSWPTVLLFDERRKLVVASPLTETTSIAEDASGSTYGIRAIDWILTRQLGPLRWVPFVSPVH